MRILPPLLIAIAFAACGAEDPQPRARVTASPTATATATPAPATPKPLYSERSGCFPAGAELRFCRDERGYGSLRNAAGRVPVERPRGAGRWTWAAAAPDGRTILMQWSAECEVPLAFLVPARGGRPRPLAGRHVNSMGLGWTTDGRAIVFVPGEPACGAAGDAGLFLVGADGARERIGPAGRRPPIRPSVRPRPARRLRGAYR